MQKKKSGVEKCLEILPLRGGVGRLMANAILNFHFDYWHTSLISTLVYRIEESSRLRTQGNLTVTGGVLFQSVAEMATIWDLQFRFIYFSHTQWENGEIENVCKRT